MASLPSHLLKAILIYNASLIVNVLTFPSTSSQYHLAADAPTKYFLFMSAPQQQMCRVMLSLYALPAISRRRS